jgi:sRNA-binding carbon storage regulator CsrA
MLIISRRPGESLFIDLAESVDPDMTVGELFSDGPVEVAIMGVKGDQVKVGTEAPSELSIMRDELVQ